MAKKIYSKRCEHCYKLYEARREKSKYCSDGCRVMAYKKRHGIPLPDFTSLSAIQQKFQSAESVKVRDLSNKLLVLSAKRRSAEAEYERHRRIFEAADEDLRQKIENRHHIYNQNSVERCERKRDESIEKMNEAMANLTRVDKEAVKIQEALRAAEEALSVATVQKKQKSISSKELRSKSFDVLPIEGQWEAFLGHPERGFLLMLHGTPFSGKSSLCLRLLDYLSAFGSCLYISAEEGISESFKRKVQKHLSPSSEVTIVEDRFASSIKRTVPKFDFAVIDSIQAATLSTEDLESLIGEKTSIIGVLQSTKDGNYRGGADYAHLADIIWAVSLSENGQQIEVQKNRFF